MPLIQLWCARSKWNMDLKITPLLIGRKIRFLKIFGFLWIKKETKLVSLRFLHGFIKNELSKVRLKLQIRQMDSNSKKHSASPWVFSQRLNMFQYSAFGFFPNVKMQLRSFTTSNRQKVNHVPKGLMNVGWLVYIKEFNGTQK